MKQLRKNISLIILFFFFFGTLLDSSGTIFTAYAADENVDISINFQPEGNTPNGYIADNGEIYGTRNGYTYGWNKSHSDTVYERNLNSDKSLDTLIELKPDGVWEMALPNGDYDVTLSVGDAVYGTNLNNTSVKVENTSFFSNITLQENEFKSTNQKVTVSDGKITLYQEGTNKTNIPINYIHIVTASENNSYAIKLEMYNGNTSDTVNTLFPRFKLSNTGTSDIDLSKVKIEYYFTNDNGQKLNFWCDWSSVGSDKITDNFINKSYSSKADTSLELGFNNAGNLASGQSVELHTRVADIDWKNMSQYNDYSFNCTNSSYISWTKAVVYINGTKVWGIAPDEIVPEQTTTPTPTGTTSPTSTPTPSTTPSTTPTPTSTPSQNSKVELQMYNQSKAPSEKNISPDIKLINNGNEPIDMKNVKIRYYYMVGGDTPQNFWCDWASLGTGNVKGSFVKMPKAMVGADSYVELTFDSSTGLLNKGQNAEIKTRFARSSWTEYVQSDDYSFNPQSSGFVDWSKVTVYIGDELVWGIEPSQLLQPKTDVKVQMYNAQTNDNSNTIHPMLKLYNTGNVQFNLSDVVIRYYYTKEGNEDENFWCDWSSIGANHITHEFITLPEKFTNENVKNFVDIGFTSDTGNLIAGDTIEIQTRFSKTDWSSYKQSNDYSFNSTSNTKYIDWDKVSVYVKGKLIWGNGVIAQTPSQILSEATENTVSLSWEEIYAAKRYDVEADGVVKSVGSSVYFSDTGLEPGTEHKYRIRAVSNVNIGDWSEYVDIWTVPGITQNISALSTSSSIIVSWEPIEGVTSYEIEVAGMPVNVGMSTSYVHEGLGPNTQRAYRVRGINSSGYGKWSEVISKSTLPGSSFAISTAPKSDSITLLWDKSSGATGYDLEADGVVISDIDECQYIHENLLPSTEHSYRVRPKNQDGIGQWTEMVKVYTLPEVPEGLSAVVTGDSISVCWNEAKGAETYEIEIDGVVLDNGDKTTYLYSGLKNNSEHVFRVRAIYKGNASIWSKTVSSATLTAIPENLTANTIGNGIELVWDMVEGATYYEIEVNGTVVTGISTNKYTFENVDHGTKYLFKIRSVGKAGAGKWSTEVECISLIGTPQGFTATAADNSISLEWLSVKDATGYEVMTDGDLESVSTDTYYIHRGLKPNTMHVYRVRALNGSTAGQWTEPLIKTTIQGIPGNVRAKLINEEVLVMWEPVNGATSYEINADGNIIDTHGDTYFMHTGLAVNSSHTYSVRSKKDAVVSGWSNKITILTSPEVPENLQATATTNAINLSWDSVSGAVSYDVEVDGKVHLDIGNFTEYMNDGLEANTRHYFRVRSRNSESVSEWSEMLQKNTNPELMIKAEKDGMFNFVFVIPANYTNGSRTITVEYNPNELEVLDLCAVTPAYETKTGKIEGTDITVESFAPGKIVYTISDTSKTEVNSIKFMAKVGGYAKVVYEVK